MRNAPHGKCGAEKFFTLFGYAICWLKNKCG